MASSLDMKSHGSFFALSFVRHLIEEKQSAKGSEPEAGRAGTQFVLHPEFSISMVSMQMLWPQAPGEPGPSVLWCMAALQWPAGLHCPSLSWALPAWEGGGAWRLRAPTSQGSAEIIRVPEPL